MLLNALKKIGFTQQEAIIYIYLCKNGELTGYEAAKYSGISRSNAYAALSSLVDKGYAHVIEGTSSKYIAVPKEELIKNAERDFNENIKIIRDNLEFNAISQEPYITITGELHIVDKLKNMIETAEKRIYISCGKDTLKALEVPLCAAIARQLKVVVLSPELLTKEKTYTHYYTQPTESFKLITDTKAVIAGNFKQSLYSKNTTLVTLLRESFIHEIAVIEAKQDNKGE